MQGRVDKIAKEMALLEQAFVKDTSKTVAGGVAGRAVPHLCILLLAFIHHFWGASLCLANPWAFWPDEKMRAGVGPPCNPREHLPAPHKRVPVCVCRAH